MNVPSELVVEVELDPEHPEPSVTSTHTFALWTYPERITTPLNETEITSSVTSLVTVTVKSLDVLSIPSLTLTLSE